MSAKETLRREILILLKQFNATKLQQASLVIATKLQNLPQLQAAQKIGVFQPFLTEPNLETAYQIWQQAGKKLVYPPANPNDWPRNLQVILVPGLAFTHQGERLGRGRGYYDHSLAQLPQTLKIGVCFSDQILDHLPVESHDQALDLIISDN